MERRVFIVIITTAFNVIYTHRHTQLSTPYSLPLPLVIKSTSPPIEIEVPTPQKQQDQITRYECRENPQIPPPISIFEPQRLVKLFAHLIRAVFARTSRVIHDIPGSAIPEKRSHVFPARQSRRRREPLQFARRADDLAALELGDDHAPNEPGEGIKLIEPAAPETGNLRARDGDPAEEGEDDDDKRVEEGGDEGRRGHGGEHLAESDGKEFGDEDDEELVAGSVGSGLEGREVVDGEEEADGAEDTVGKFGEDHGKGECELTVGFGGGFAVEDEAGQVVFWFDLGEDEGREDGGLEDDEDTVLEGGAGVIELEVR